MFGNALLAPLFLSFLAAFVATVGLITVAVRSDWSQKYAHLLAVMASGLLLTMVITHLAPEAIKGHANAPLFMLGGFFLGLLTHDVLRVLLPVPDSRTLAAGLTPLIAIAVHSLLDGVIYTVTFSKGLETGLLATLGLVIHEFPEGVVTFALLRGAGLSNKNSFFWAFLAAALTTPLGAIATIPMVQTVDASGLSLMFAVSAGLLLFVSTGPLMAHMRDEKPTRTLPALLIGVVLAILIAQSHLPHLDGHDHEHPVGFE